MQYAAAVIQYAAAVIQHATAVIQYAAAVMQYAAVDIQYAAAVIQSVTADIHLLYCIIMEVQKGIFLKSRFANVFTKILKIVRQTMRWPSLQFNYKVQLQNSENTECDWPSLFLHSCEFFKVGR